MDSARAGGPQGAGGLMRVDAKLVREHLVRSLLEDARRLRSIEPHPAVIDEPLADYLATLTEGPEPELAARVAALGYFARRVEMERFAPARAEMTWVAEHLVGGATAAQVVLGLALAEPEGRPEPTERSATWRVPGPGGHVRYYLGLESAAAESPGASPGTAAALRRCWLLGFFARCLEERHPASSDR